MNVSDFPEYQDNISKTLSVSAPRPFDRYLSVGWMFLFKNEWMDGWIDG